jgi:hypothetical protein
VQLAYKTEDGEMIVESVHSKISSKAWPDKHIHDKVDDFNDAHRILSRSALQEDDRYYFSGKTLSVQMIVLIT